MTSTIGEEVLKFLAFLDRVIHYPFRGHQERLAGTGLMADDGADKLPDVTEAELIMAAKRIQVRKGLGLAEIPGLTMKTTQITLVFLRSRLAPVFVREPFSPTQG